MNIGFGLFVFSCIWEHALKICFDIFWHHKSVRPPKIEKKTQKCEQFSYRGFSVNIAYIYIYIRTYIKSCIIIQITITIDIFWTLGVKHIGLLNIRFWYNPNSELCIRSPLCFYTWGLESIYSNVIFCFSIIIMLWQVEVLIRWNTKPI